MAEAAGTGGASGAAPRAGATREAIRPEAAGVPGPGAPAPDTPGPGAPRPPAASAASRPDLRTVALVGVLAILLGWALRAMSVVLIPLATAILVALAVMPVRDWVRARVPERVGWLGPAAALGVVLAALLALASLVAVAARQVVADIPVDLGQVVEIVRGAGAEGGGPEGAGGAVAAGAEAGASGEIAEAAEAAEAGTGAGREAAGREAAGTGAAGTEAPPGAGPTGGEGDDLLSGGALQSLRALGDRALEAAGGAAAGLLGSALSVLGGLVLVVFLTLMILVESGDWRRKARAALPWPGDARLGESAGVIAQKVRAFLLIQAGIGLISATLYALWLGVWGVGLLVVWPILIFVLNFVPTVGSIVGGTLVVAYALLTEGAGTAVGVGLGILVIEQVMGNLVGPRLEGRNVSLSPLVVLVALVFWGWAWGIAGALLAVPMTVALVVLAAHVPSLRPWALMLSNQTSWAGLDEATRPEEAPARPHP